MIKIGLILLGLIISSCSSVGTKNIQKVPVQSSASYAKSFDTVWGDAVAWVAMNNLPLDKIDKESGLLTSDFGLGPNQKWVHCGEPTGNIGLYTAKFDGMHGYLNILIRKKGDDIRATINVFGRARVVLRNGYGLVGESANDCYSTGELEQAFHESMAVDG